MKVARNKVIVGGIVSQSFGKALESSTVLKINRFFIIMLFPRKIFASITLLSVALLVSGCPRNRRFVGRGAGAFFVPRKVDRCSYIKGSQYPYDWQGSNEGACIRVLPDRYVTQMVPDSIGGLFMVPKQVRISGGVSIEAPVGNGVGDWSGGPGNIKGTITNNQGSFYFTCDGVAVTGRNRGLCYW